MTWEQALAWVKEQGFCGSSDWRLPNINELESLVHMGTAGSPVWLETLGFTNVASYDYWTSTTDVDNPSRAWYVQIGSGGVYTLNKDGDLYGHVWPVRGVTGPPAEQWKTGQDLCYLTNGTITDCTDTGQDGHIRAGATWPTPRFTDHSDGTVTDELTGLIWTKDANAPGPSGCYPNDHKSWGMTYTYIRCLNDRSYLGFNNWRVPNRKELRSLIDYSQSGPALPSGHPFTNVQTDYDYRSSTGVAYLAGLDYAWKVSIDTGLIGTGWNGHALSVWPVRGGLRYFRLTIMKGGTGSGTVTSVPDGIDCGGSCSYEFTGGTVITLTATPLSESTFSGWSGSGCTGTGDCVFTMTADTTVTATFALEATLQGTIGTQFSINGSGFGAKKGKVRIGGATTKITYWDDSRIDCTAKKVPLPPESYPLVVFPKKPLTSITAGDFLVMNPDLDPLSHDHGSPEAEITVTGKFFGTKKGKVYLEDPATETKKACKVTEWSMYDPVSGDSRIRFIVPTLPKDLLPGLYTLKVINKVGTDSATFTVD